MSYPLQELKDQFGGGPEGTILPNTLAAIHIERVAKDVMDSFVQYEMKMGGSITSARKAIRDNIEYIVSRRLEKAGYDRSLDRQITTLESALASL